ncbi:MAG: glucose-1-phosphate thymidylyltransferase [Chlamydiales bacterium]
MLSCCHSLFQGLVLNFLRTEELFDLDQISFSKLFLETVYPWEVLFHLKAFFETQTLGSIQTEIPEGAILVDPENITIGKGTIIEPGSYIKGPCIIGQNCTVRQGAYIRGYCLTGDNCVIGHATEVKHSIFLNHAKAAHFAYLGDSILGSHVNLGAGVKCANLRLDESEIILKLLDGHYSTGLRKLGAILGDYVQIGCNAVTNPGTVMGKRSHCFPCINIGGIIPQGSVVKPSVTPTIAQAYKQEVRDGLPTQ